MKPLLMYGTAWKEEKTERCVRDALLAGFRAIDTANQRKHYHEAAVGAAVHQFISEGQVSRGELFLQTKFTSVGGQDHRLPYDPEASPSEQVRQSFVSSLEHLQTDYVDSYVLHGPTYRVGWSEDDLEVWKAMESLAKTGKAKSLGVSNVSLEQLELLVEGAEIKPNYVQNRCFARTGWDSGVREFCNKNEICYQGFSLLTANPEVFSDGRLEETRLRLGCTPAQVIFSFSVHLGMLPLTGTTDPEHMKADLEAIQLKLTADEIRKITKR